MAKTKEVIQVPKEDLKPDEVAQVASDLRQKTGETIVQYLFRMMGVHTKAGGANKTTRG